jgi:hypothetical protein
MSDDGDGTGVDKLESNGHYLAAFRRMPAQIAFSVKQHTVLPNIP